MGMGVIACLASSIRTDLSVATPQHDAPACDEQARHCMHQLNLLQLQAAACTSVTHQDSGQLPASHLVPPGGKVLHSTWP
jgi:hypothetical protein